MPKVFVTRPVPAPGGELLRDAFGAENVDVFEHDSVIPRAELLERVKGVDGLLPILTERVDAELLDAAGPQLKVVANYAVGYNNIDVPSATQRNVIVTNTPDVLTEATADTAWALLLAAARRIGEGERYLRAGQWTSWGPQLLLGVDLVGRTLGVFGMGRIGQAMARKAKGFNMRVLYTDAAPISAEKERELNASCVDKATLLRESDFISIHCPLFPETRHAFSTAEFSAMKNSAVLVNTARGPIVDEPALAAALQAGEIFAAGLDVFEEEPKIHPALLECENAVLIPHLGSATRDTRSKMAEIAAKNIVAVLTGQPPITCVNPEVLG